MDATAAAVAAATAAAGESYALSYILILALMYKTVSCCYKYTVYNFFSSKSSFSISNKTHTKYDYTFTAGKRISPLVQTPVNNEIRPKISPTVKIAGSTVTNTIKPPTYVLDAQSLVEWLKKSESRLSGVVLPEEMTQDLAALEILIHSFGVISSSSTQLDTNSHINDQMGDQMMEDDRDLNQNQNQSSAANSNIKGMLAVTSSAQKILRIGASLGGDIFLYVLSKLFRAAVVRTYPTSQFLNPSEVSLLSMIFLHLDCLRICVNQYLLLPFCYLTHYLISITFNYSIPTCCSSLIDYMYLLSVAD